MGEHTGIAWCDHTWNPWWGCTKVGPGCDHCYAEKWAARTGHAVWGSGTPRRFFGDEHWREPLKWDAKAARAGKMTKVFCASMADVFDNEIEQRHRDRIWDLVRTCPSIIWQIVTKRIGNAARMLPADWGNGWRNVWLIATVVDQAEADRDVPKLLATPARVRGLSIEPQLGPIDLRRINTGRQPEGSGFEYIDALSGIGWFDGVDGFCILNLKYPRIDWVITGGESGKVGVARPYRIEWARSLIAQCRGAGVACFVKQLGSNCADSSVLRAAKGDDPAEWPRDIRVREFPNG